jgi:DNA-binding GntR family transcriptional regulator
MPRALSRSDRSPRRAARLPASPLNKHELAYRLIRERIEAAVYQPGQRLVIDAT